MPEAGNFPMGEGQSPGEAAEPVGRIEIRGRQVELVEIEIAASGSSDIARSAARRRGTWVPLASTAWLQACGAESAATRQRRAASTA